MSPQFLEEVVRKAEAILSIREEEGLEPARALWNVLDKETNEMRGDLPPYVFDLIIQVEFLLEEDPMADMSEAKHTLYLAKSSLQNEKGR
jgi:hypothetical protein